MEITGPANGFLRDWRATINDLLVENFFGRMAALARGIAA